MKLGLERVTPPKFIQNGSDTIDIRQRFVLAALLVLLSYRWTVAGGTGAGAIAADVNFRILQKVVVSVNGNDIMSFSGQFLNLYNKMFLRQILTQVPPTLIAAATDQAAREAWYLIPFYMGHSVNPEEYGLPSMAVVEPTITFYWGDGKDGVIGGDATSITLNDGVVTVLERPYIDSKVPRGGFKPLLVKQQTVDVLQTGELDVEIKHLMNGHYLRAVFIEALAGGSGGRNFAYNDSVITSFRFLIGGSPKFEKSIWKAMQQVNKVNYQLAALETGVIVLDAAGEDQKTSLEENELWPIKGTERPRLTLDVVKQSGDNKVIITTVHTAP